MIPYSRPKLSDSHTLSQSKLQENHTLNSGTYLYSPYMIVPPGFLTQLSTCQDGFQNRDKVYAFLVFRATRSFYEERKLI